MSGAGSLSNVALRPWPSSVKEPSSKDELFAQIHLLTNERGHLRDITEKTLQSEIDAGKDVPDTLMEGIEQEQKKEAPSTEEQLKEIQRVRDEMLEKAQWAAFAAGNALDLIALLLSKEPSKNLESAYSQMFQQQKVPRGSMGVDKGVNPIHEKQELADAKRRELVMKASRMEALDSATDSLLNAATELETEIQKETKYWEEILSISEKGWSLQRPRKGVRNAPFAVRYGFPEASNHFKARDLAPLRMNKDGGIILDPALALKPKTMRVQISDDGKVTGNSHLPAQSDLENLAIEQSIHLARDSLFEEELFHEISMETRQLLGYGVELRNSAIHITAPGLSTQSSRRKIVIDCIDRDGDVPPSIDHSQDWLAQNIAEFLRVLLAYEHRMRLHRRSQIPPPLTQRKREQPNPPLLRTLLSLFSHLNAVNNLHAYLDATAKTLKSAGLDITLETSRESSWVKLADTINESENKDLSATEQLLATFIRPFEATASISLPSSNRAQAGNITVATRTYIGPPHFGAEHKVTFPPSLARILGQEHEDQQQFKFRITEEVKSYLNWILSMDLAHNYLVKEYSNRSVIKSTEPQLTILSKGTKKDSVKEDDVSIEVEDGSLKMTATAGARLATGAVVESFTWNGTAGQVSLKDKIKSWMG